MAIEIEIDEFSPRRRKTRYPYEEWLRGKPKRLFPLEDFKGSPQKLADSINAYARRHDFAAVAVVAKDKETGDPILEVWGDRSRSWSEGPTPEVRAKLEALGHRFRRRLSR